MKKSFLEFPPGTTPLNINETNGLKLTYISTQSELNAAEQANILEGEQWALSKKRKNFLTEKFMRDLHKKMFGHVWTWAGTYRISDKSIGMTWHKIPTEIATLIQDARYWITHETYPIDEIAARFHHRLTWIHPFPNGNGRWARTITDVLLFNLNQPLFTWGLQSNPQALSEHTQIRDRYIHALAMADTKNYTELLKFVRS